MKILKAVLAPYFFLTSPASYADAGEPEIDDPVLAQLVRVAQLQLRNNDLTVIDLDVKRYEHVIRLLEKGPGPWAVLGVPLRPLDWKDRVLQPGDVWTTRGGEKIHVNYMSNNHVIHTVAYLERRCAKHTPRYGRVKGELNRRIAEGLDAMPVTPYEPVDKIEDDELGDNRKTMGYRKAKFGTTPVPPYVHKDHIDWFRPGDLDYWYDDEAVEHHYF